MESISREALLDAWADGGAESGRPLVLCATRRLALDLQQQHGLRQQQRSLAAWVSPPCLAWDHWLAAQHREARMTAALQGEILPRLLDPAATSLLWRQAVAADGDSPALLDGARAAALAGEAWTVAREAGIPLPLDAQARTADSDVAAFDRWLRHFLSALRRHRLITPAELPEACVGWMQRGWLPVPDAVVVAGFDQHGAARQRLLDHLQAMGCHLRQLAPPRHRARIVARSCSDPRVELLDAARQVQRLAEARPEARIAVVVPDLAARREAVLAAFDAVLCPDRAPDDDPAERPYNLSLGQPLAAAPAVADALAWLDWLSAPDALPLERVQTLLYSPHWRGREALPLLAGIDWRWHQRGHEGRRPRHLLAALRQAAEVDSEPGRPARQLADAVAAAELPTDTAPPSQWAARLAASLRALGWPHHGDHGAALGSAAFQTLQAWNEALAALGRLDRLTPPLRARGAVALLRDSLKLRIFQPRTPPRSIQILGVLEAAGLAFDHLLLLGMDESRWPPPPGPSPFLPLPQQRAAQLPQASAEGQRARAARLTEALLQSAPQVTWCWARSVDDQEVAPSPLLPPPCDDPPPHDDRLPPRWRLLSEAAASTPWQDQALPAPAAGSLVAGGVARLADQAECPFRGAARHELGAAAAALPEPGPDARERGTLIHDVMAAIWRELREQAALLRLSDRGREALIRQAVDEALSSLQQRRPQRLGDAAAAVEGERLAAHARSLLDLDSRRGDFRVEIIEGFAAELPEAARRQQPPPELALAKLRFRVIPDRVDLLPGFGRVVIDYKSGATVSPLAAHLRAPQLPAYAELVADCVGVAYAVARAGDVGYRGIIDRDCAAEFPGLRPHHQRPSTAQREHDLQTWEAIRDHWRGQLQTLAEDIAAGVAEVAPLPQACRYCDLQPLCRIDGRVDERPEAS